jgi:DNA invertase Pin-like site-specific DNA recombinase
VWNNAAIMKPKAAPLPVCILVRVSTNKQETDRQINELEKVAKDRGWKVAEICEEKISGSAKIEERAALMRALELAQSGSIKKVLVHEISRVARRSSVAHTFVEKLEECGVSLYWHAQGVETLLPNGKRNPSASIMLAILAEMARAEKETLQERIKSGLVNARKHGTKSGRAIGRPKGTSLEAADFLAKHKDVVKLLREGQSIRHAAKISGKGGSTVQRVAAAMKAAA